MIDRFSPLARNIALVVIFLLLAWFLWTVRAVVNPLILAYLLAFVLHPLVLHLERRGWRRRKAVNFIFTATALLITALGVGIFFQGRGLARELSTEQGLQTKVRQRVDQALEEYRDEINWVLRLVPHRNGPPPEGATPADGSAPVDAQTPAADLHSEDLTRLFREWWSSYVTEEQKAQAGEIGIRAASGAYVFLRGVFGSLLAFLGLMVLLPIYTYFLLFELERIHSFVARYLPRRDRARLVGIGRQIGGVLSNFFRGRLLVALCKGLFYALGLWLAGVEFALLLGLGTGFLSLVPFVGSAFGFVTAMLVAMLEHSLGSALLRIGIVFLLAEGLENYLLIPKILGDSLGLHPVVVIFALLAGGASLGMFGLLIALPLAASLVILGREFLLPVLADLADKDGRDKDLIRP
jgi:predicted PurR-regulated permease PerM